MSENSQKDQTLNQRVCNRILVTKRILLELDNGDILQGESRDISPRGVLMKADFQPDGDLQGVTGTLYVISDEGDFSSGFPCNVVRSKDKSIALEIRKSTAAAFGNYMARHLLGI